MVCAGLSSGDPSSKIHDHQIGKVSPRAFCCYDPAGDPKPKYFKEVLENTFGEQDLKELLPRFYQVT